ncbi:cell division cycle 5-related protein, putative [Phytophthora infestans T30-4]|uniref:Cell division cycle 5-related protein, putative n=1 Tax=Phytophthora infestans (strain T30-4) TaxID=403677 RepID=D0MTG8_PHYIT|nr:cell division cycle 5-related protein, putative [Phytophthora infestans T30-4]EEY61265.1 cell division cycle 5-related protein, putative [Phytophthora infestans T30-4]|eukprot:XP_002908182.1 cell division cycle 5-related protein, putative [Phytophthora infestans T30-4]
MRIMIKGGVWKNTEDEILKAAVMKYGMNQWARVASLLSRKSAKQCKARWYEWLDPSIKKTEWSREEEEKLLHLAKLMPSQWRTIAPIVGRTAAQCMEHYERLLDAAQQKEGVEVSDDPRRLRPGEIDPNPENKPARPDPVDMDEDEKEMLSEARARLANTKGKKAKRKAREKQLEEARRLAVLQKKRELKAAGIMSSNPRVSTKKRKFIDYSSEIPFEKRAPAGFYDVSEENRLSSKGLDPKHAALQLDKFEGVRRDAQEKKERKQDAKRQRSLMKANLPQLIAAVNEKNDPINAIKRTPLELPAPVVSNDELSDLAKLGLHATHAAATETRALMGDYSITPLRSITGGANTTPFSRDVHENIIQETANLLAMRDSTTPLLGGENVELYEGTGYVGATPSRTPSSAVSSTVNDKTPMSAACTPLRDELRINPEQLYGTEAENAKAEKARTKRQAASLRKGFDSLPAPQNEYEINAPDNETNDEDRATALLEEDAGEREARKYHERELERGRELMRRSAAVQKGLPRPSKVKKLLIHNEIDEVADEMYRMLEHDVVKYPVDDGKAKNSKKRKKSSRSVAIPNLQQFSDSDMERARQMVQVEATLSGVNDVWKSKDALFLGAKWEEVQARHLSKAESEGKSGDVFFQFADSQGDKLCAVQARFAELKEAEQFLAKRAHKLDERARVVNGGFYRRSQHGLELLRDHMMELQNAAIEQACFKNLSSLETQALQSRMARSANEVNSQQLTEVKLQKHYAALIQEQQ